MQNVPVEISSQVPNLSALLLPFVDREMSGCLRLLGKAMSWSIYLEQGKLVYASNSIDPLGRLDRHLRRLSLQVPTLISAVRMQVRLSFEAAKGAAEENSVHLSRDYQAICWLVEQQYLQPKQAQILIEEIAQEIFESLLREHAEGYEFQENCLAQAQKLHQLDLKDLLEQCQSRLRQHQALGQMTNPTLSRSNSIASAKPYAISEVARQLAVKTKSLQNSGAAANQASGLSAKAVHTIVCIDDSPSILKTINSYLDDQSFSTVLINDPVRALMQIIRCKPNLILLDINMPGLDGYELCSLLRRNRSFKTTPIIMVTSNSGLLDRARAKMVGASGYLTKPFSQPDLVKIVFKYLS
jgi:two-component system, chemotaxis family, response regulator PixG